MTRPWHAAPAVDLRVRRVKRRREENSRGDEAGVRGGEGVVHHQPVPALRQQPLHVQLQLGPRGGLEVPHAGGALRVGAAQGGARAGRHLLVAVAVFGGETTQKVQQTGGLEQAVVWIYGIYLCIRYSCGISIDDRRRG